MKIYNADGKEVNSTVEVIHQSPREVTLGIYRLASGTYVIMVESSDSRVFVGTLVKK